MIDTAATFAQHEENEYGCFEKIEKKRSQRPDLHAFLLLDEIAPGSAAMVAAAEHDEIYLGVSPEAMAQATEEQIVELIRCGVRYDERVDSLAMFV